MEGEIHRRPAGNDRHRAGDAGLPGRRAEPAARLRQERLRGQPDQALADQKVEALRQRSAGQKF
jgi:hypothetical protein